MKKHVLALSVSIILISNIYSIKAEAEIPEKLIIFGDSLSDNGNILRFTLNQENVYNEYLANYFGYSSPRHDGNFFTKRNQDGPNYALGGAVANNNLGGLSGFMSPKISDEIQNYLKSNRNLKDRDTKYVFWIGGNDLRLADDDIKLNTYSVNTDQSNNEKILGSIQAVEQQIRKLLVDAKAKFLIVPNAPNIGNTPNFINNFLADGEIYYNGGYKKLAGCNGGGWNCFWGVSPKVSKEELIRFLDDQKHPGKSARDVIYDVFEYAVRKHYRLTPEQPLTQHARNELDLWKDHYDLVFKAETSLVNTFNQGVDRVIEYFKKHPDYQDVTFIRPNIQLLLDEVIEHYQDFGFNNVVGSPADSFTSGVIGKGAGSGRIAAFEPKDGVRGEKDKEYLWNKGYKYVFADQFHPSPKTHRMIYDYIVSLLESESGDPIDMNIKRISTTPFSSTDRKIYHSAEDDGVFNTTYVSGVNQITKSDLDIYNDGRALFAADGGVIRLTNSNITSQGRLGGIINAEQKGKIYLTNGYVDVYRTNPYVAPFGVMVNGDDSLVKLDNIRLNTYGKETTAITVGNNAEVHLINSIIKSNGIGANVLNLWDSKATIIKSTLKTDSENASAVRVFANDNSNRVATLVADGSTLTSANHYAIKVAENVTQNPAILYATLTNSVVNGDIYTSEPNNNRFLHSKSYFSFDKNSSWNIRGNSNVTSLSLKDSTLNLSQSSDNWNAKTLSIANDFITQNSYIRLGTDLSDDNSKTDKIVVKGISILNANLYIDKRNSSLGSSTQAGIKVIDLNGDKSNTGTISLAKEINAGIYQYLLTHGGIGADDQSDWYLTSSYIKHNDQATPVIIKPENTGTTDRSSNVPKENRPTEGVAKPTETAQPAQPTEEIAKPAEPTQPTEAVAKPAETAQPAQPTEAVAKPTEPAQPAQPTEEIAKPAEPAQPAQPTEAVAKPTEPAQPAQPTEAVAKPVETAQPAQPTEAVAKPTEPAQPAQPTEAVAKPAETAQPAQPTEAVAKPTEPAQPAQPTEEIAKPAEPAQPAQPTEEIAKPAETAQPAQPTEEIAKPAEPAQPAQPTEEIAKPAETAQPAQPTEEVAKPTEPAQPAQPTEEIAKPAETAQPAQPTEEVAKPTEPAQPAQPTEEIAKPAEPAQPAQPTEEIAKPAETAQPAQPTEAVAKPTEPVQPAQPTEEIAKPAETAQPAQPTEAVAKPTEPAQPAQPTEAVAKPVETAQPAQPTEAVAKPTEPAQPAQPTEAVAKPVETAQPAQPTEEIAKPAETTQPTQPTKAVAKPAESEIKPILNKDATLFSALPYISQSVGERHLEYSVRNPNVPLWGRKDGLDYWVNMAYIYNQVKGKDFLNLQQNAQILAMGKDLVTTDNTLFGISSTYSRTNTSVDNYSNCQLGLHCASGKVTSEMISINGYYLYDWGNWYVQTVLSAGKVKHKFKNSSNFTYGINGYIISSEQTLGYRYPLNENLALYSDIGLQETYHRYSSTSVEEIHVDKINQYNVNALMNVGIQYQVEAFTLSSNLRVIKNLHDFNYLKMNNVNIQDKFAKDRASLSTNARYYITDNVSLFMNFEYLRSLNNDRINKFKQLNYQVGVNIQF